MTIEYGTSNAVLNAVKKTNQQWFAPGNKEFFGDIDYQIMYGKQSGERYLVRSTYAWTDMFGQPKTKHYRINYINDNLKIGQLVDILFKSKEEVKDWLKVH